MFQTTAVGCNKVPVIYVVYLFAKYFLEQF